MRLMGDAIYANLFLLGYAWQLGMVPVTHAAIDRAIELNGAAVELNRRAFLWGRRAAHDPATVDRFVTPADPVPEPGLDDIIARRVAYLTAYQDAAYAARYRVLVDQVRAAEAPLHSTRLTAAVARNYFKLLAIKDEYEVARLYVETDFLDRVRETFEGDYELHVHLAPPLLAKADPTTGRIKKIQFGPWMFRLFRWLAPLRKYRGTRWDIFARLPERRMERQLIADYEYDIAQVLAQLSPQTLDIGLKLAVLPEGIRGFGHVKTQGLKEARKLQDALRIELATR
jgi:indolepyruvate ferredoxin oxidoreductase